MPKLSLARVVARGPTNVDEDYIKNTKWRKTCTYEPKHMVRNYQLDQCRFLVETETPSDEQSLASQHRQTTNILNLRKHGMRWSQTPDHSEQNFSLMERDPRGYSNLPDFQRVRQAFNYRASKYEYMFGVDGVESHVDKRRDGIRLQADMQELKERRRRTFANFSYSLAGQARGGLSHNPDGTIVTMDKMKGMRQMGEAMDDNTKQQLMGSSMGYVPMNSERQIGYYAINDARLPITDYTQTPVSGRQLLMATYHERKHDQKVREQKDKSIKRSMVLTMQDQMHRKGHTNEAKGNMMQLAKASKDQKDSHSGRTDTDNHRHNMSLGMHKTKQVKKSNLRNMRLDVSQRKAIESQSEDRRVRASRQQKTLSYKSYQPDPTQDLGKVELDTKFKRGRSTMMMKSGDTRKSTNLLDYSNYEHDKLENRGRVGGMARPSSYKSTLGKVESTHGHYSSMSRSSGRGGIANRSVRRNATESDNATNYGTERRIR